VNAAYLILSHYKAKQVEDLALRILELSPNGHVVIHHDANAADMPFDGSPPDRVHLVERSTVLWGDWSIVEATLQMIRYAYDVIGADWFVCISGEDRPVVNLDKWERSVSERGIDFQSRCWPAPCRASFGRKPDGNESSYVRATYRWRRVPEPRIARLLAIRVMRPLIWLSLRLQPLFSIEHANKRTSWFVGSRSHKNALPSGWKIYWGVQWMAFSRRAAKLALEVDPNLEAHFRYAFIPDQLFFQTIFGNAAELLIERELVCYVPWKKAAARHNQLWLRREDIADVRASGAPFARKYNPEIDPQMIETIDAEIDAQICS
jgi:hypothetical protein